MTTAELARKIRSLGKRERKRLLQELLDGNGLEEIADDLEDIIVSVARRRDPTIPAQKLFNRVEKKRKLKC